MLRELQVVCHVYTLKNSSGMIIWNSINKSNQYLLDDIVVLNKLILGLPISQGPRKGENKHAECTDSTVHSHCSGR